MPKGLHESLMKGFKSKKRKGGPLKDKAAQNATYGTMANILKKKLKGSKD